MRCRTLLHLFTASLVAVGSTHAAAPTLLEAVAQAPALAAAQQRLAAATARVDASGRLADPQIEGMASRTNMVEGDGNMWEVTIRQPLPKRGERAADRDRAQATAAMAEAEYAMLAGDLAADAAMALAEHAGANARARLIAVQLERMGAVLQSLESRLAAGASARIADRLTVQSRLAALQLMLEQEQQMAANAAADIRGRLSLGPDAPLPAYTAPTVAEIDVADAPALRVAAARAAEADAMGRMARASARPMTAVGLRLQREETRMGNDDVIGLAFMSEIPWRGRRYASADLRAAQAERAAARLDGDAARHRITSTLSRVTRAENLAASARRLGTETRQRLGAELDALLRNAGTVMGSDAPVFMAVDVLEKITEAEIQILQAETAAQVARAELWRYASAEALRPPAPSAQP